MGRTLRIEEAGDELVIEIARRRLWPLFRRRMGPPALGMTLVVAGIVAFLRWSGGPWTGRIADWGLVYAVAMAVVGGLTYLQVRPLTHSRRLRLDGQGVHLVASDGGEPRSFAAEAVQMLQVSELVLPFKEIRTDTRAIVPGNEQYELSLVTDSGIEVVGRGVDRREAEAAVEAFNERVS